MTPPPAPAATPRPMRVLGAILAGGQSSRFGSDKAEAPLGAKRLIDHVAAALRPQVEALIVAGGPPRAGFACVPDRPAPGLGPLGGLNAALHEAARLGFDWVLTAPCDAARLPADLAQGLHQALMQQGPEACAAYAHADGRDHPTFGLWSTSLAPTLENWLATERPARERAIRRWAASVGAIAAPLPDGSIANINTPEDLAALGALESREARPAHNERGSKGGYRSSFILESD